ncbi:MAG: pilus assembly protein PilM [Planctomycetota bacterium]|jgi:type IV pilus assembly protein PilM
MASGTQGVWAIDIGDNALKAIRLRQGGDGFEVIGFDCIEHSKILSGDNVTGGEREDIIAETLREFVSKNELGKDEVATSVAGHNSFARFVKLPPVEKKLIPKIIPQEAVQQIPFDINEVEWDWQLTETSDSPDVMLGIFAIKNELISSVIERFNSENVGITCVQISPMALYNYAMYDRKDVRESDGKPTIILDMGAENTTLVVCTKSGVWQRSIRIGGNAFTEAIAETFKLKFQKAEKLKRGAPTSKYIRQIFTAMRPVFTDLGSEVQRSLGFYGSSGAGRDKGFSKIIALGGGMKLQGLGKYLQQTLGISVIKPDSFERLSVSGDLSSAKFHENISDFAVVYGLAVQLSGEAAITGNLLPRKIARAMSWKRKGKLFTIAASVLLFVSILSFASASHERGKYARGNNARLKIKSVLSKAQSASNNLRKEISKDSALEGKIKKEMGYFKNRDVIPLLHKVIVGCLPNEQNNPAQAELYEAFAGGDVERLVSFARPERKQLFVTAVSVDYAESLASSEFGQFKTAATTSSKRSKKTAAGGLRGRYGRMGGRFGARGGMGRRFSPVKKKAKGAAAGSKGATKSGKDGPGFLVILEGYSPYKNINELLDPPGVGDDQSKWGLVKRLENLSKIMPGAPFELLEKSVTHFKCESGEIQIGATDMPAGIGVERDIERVPKKDETSKAIKSTFGRGGGLSMNEKVSVEKVLIDPMTSEEMSKTFDLITQEEVDADPDKTERDLAKKKYTDFGEPKYIVRDHWFRLKAKFLWKSAAVEKKGKSGPSVITFRKG